MPCAADRDALVSDECQGSGQDGHLTSAMSLSSRSSAGAEPGPSTFSNAVRRLVSARACRLSSSSYVFRPGGLRSTSRVSVSPREDLQASTDGVGSSSCASDVRSWSSHSAESADVPAEWVTFDCPELSSRCRFVRDCDKTSGVTGATSNGAQDESFHLTWCT